MVFIFIQFEQFDVHLTLVVKCCGLGNNQCKSRIKHFFWVNQENYVMPREVTKKSNMNTFG